jgi:hypothetical protein
MQEVAGRHRLPSTDPLNPVVNVQAGARYLASLLRGFSSLDLALMAYNAGPARIRRFLEGGAVPERFWSYPRVVNCEAERLRGRPAAEGCAWATLAAAGTSAERLARAHAPRVEEPSAGVPAGGGGVAGERVRLDDEAAIRAGATAAVRRVRRAGPLHRRRAAVCRATRVGGASISGGRPPPIA